MSANSRCYQLAFEINAPIQKKKKKVDRDFLVDLFQDLYDSNLSYVHPRISKFGRCFFNGQMFSSDFNSLSRASSEILFR